MDTLYLYTTTLTEKGDAEKLASHLLTARLIACAQIVGPLTSLYWWQDKPTTATEWLLTVKTTSGLAQAVKEEISREHPYTVPEIIGQEITDVHQGYLQWLQGEVR